MKECTSAKELLTPGETALCLFTDGRFFTSNEDGTGASGFWVLDPKRSFQRIVIFRWTRRDGERIVELFTALPGGFDGPEMNGQFRGRYTVRLRDLQMAGITTETWEDFVMTGEHPVTYVTAEMNPKG